MCERPDDYPEDNFDYEPEVDGLDWMTPSVEEDLADLYLEERNEDAYQAYAAAPWWRRLLIDLATKARMWQHDTRLRRALRRRQRAARAEGEASR